MARPETINASPYARQDVLQHKLPKCYNRRAKKALAGNVAAHQHQYRQHG